MQRLILHFLCRLSVRQQHFFLESEVRRIFNLCSGAGDHEKASRIAGTGLSMLVICLPGYWFGLGAGIATGVAYGVLQLLIDPYVLYPMQLIVDYILAFGALGLSGLFSNAKFGLLKGYITAVLGRYVFAVISGWIFFGAYAWEGWDPLPYSLAYNAIYIFAEAAVTLLILSVKPVQNLFSKLKQMALND